MADKKWIWLTWVDNGKSVYNGQTHQVKQSTIVGSKENLQPGDRVTVHWKTGKRRSWNAVVATPPVSSTKISKKRSHPVRSVGTSVMASTSTQTVGFQSIGKLLCLSNSLAIAPVL